MRENNGGRRRENEHNRREPSDVPGHGRIGGIDDPVPRAEYGDDPEAVAGAEEASPFPDFAAERAKIRYYSVERESRPDDEKHIRIRDLQGAPAMSMLLSLVHDANADGWQLSDYHESGDELLFVPFEDDAREDGDGR
jgi:hypothetical protein